MRHCVPGPQAANPQILEPVGAMAIFSPPRVGMT
jgi:hypothetical protein